MRHPASDAAQKKIWNTFLFILTLSILAALAWGLAGSARG